MHIVTDENGNVCAHTHTHEHAHTHTYEHTHPHDHEHGAEENHNHSHDDAHCHHHEDHCPSEGSGGNCHSHGDGGHCHGCQSSEASPADKTAALLQYMLDHNTHHAAELDQMEDKLTKEGHEKAAEQIRKAVDEFQKGNLYLGLALSLVKEA